MSAVAAGIGATGAMVSSYFNYRTQKRYLDWLKKFLAPDLAAKKVALPALTQLAMGYYLPRVGKESAALTSAHTLNMQDITRQTGLAQRGSARYWGVRGDTGRARGEAMRIRLAGSRLRAQETLGYAQAQEAYQAGTAEQASDILTRLGGLGTAANSMAVDLTQMRMQNAQDLFGDIGAFLGDMAALYPFGGKKTVTSDAGQTSASSGTASSGTATPPPAGSRETTSRAGNKGATAKGQVARFPERSVEGGLGSLENPWGVFFGPRSKSSLPDWITSLPGGRLPPWLAWILSRQHPQQQTKPIEWQAGMQ